MTIKDQAEIKLAILRENIKQIKDDGIRNRYEKTANSLEKTMMESIEICERISVITEEQKNGYYSIIISQIDQAGKDTYDIISKQSSIFK